MAIGGIYDGRNVSSLSHLWIEQQVQSGYAHRRYICTHNEGLVPGAVTQDNLPFCQPAVKLFHMAATIYIIFVLFTTYKRTRKVAHEPHCCFDNQLSQQTCVFLLLLLNFWLYSSLLDKFPVLSCVRSRFILLRIATDVWYRGR